uniref:Uncharacterized protein n=1 Tax=Ditylenchus dipsaci TaxID=166011 RepID=A0A915DRE3_9BILA
MVDQLCEDMSTLTTNDELQQEAQQGSVTPNNELQPEAQPPSVTVLVDQVQVRLIEKEDDKCIWVEDSKPHGNLGSFVITVQMDTIIIGVRDVKSCTRKCSKNCPKTKSLKYHGSKKLKRFCFESTGFMSRSFLQYLSKVLPKVLEKAPRSPIYVNNEAEQDLKLKNGPAMLYALVNVLGQVIWIGICKNKRNSWRGRIMEHKKNFQQHGTHVYAVLLTKDAHVLDIEKGEYFCIVAQDLKKHVIPPTTIPILQLDNKMCPHQDDLRYRPDFLEQHTNWINVLLKGLQDPTRYEKFKLNEIPLVYSPGRPDENLIPSPDSRI